MYKKVKKVFTANSDDHGIKNDINIIDLIFGLDVSLLKMMIEEGIKK
jgi:hypothetical protein